MTTITLDRNLDYNDFLFAAMNDGAYADLRDSRQMDEQRKQQEMDGPQVSLGTRVRKFFTGR